MNGRRAKGIRRLARLMAQHAAVELNRPELEGERRYAARHAGKGVITIFTHGPKRVARLLRRRGVSMSNAVAWGLGLTREDIAKAFPKGVV